MAYTLACNKNPVGPSVEIFGFDLIKRPRQDSHPPQKKGYTPED